MVDMQNWLTSSPFELSGGQKQRTTLAGVLVNDVDILLFDEPLANLDPATGKTAIEIIEEICSSVNKTIIIIEHRLEDVLHRYVDRIIVINEGRIIANTNAHALVSSDILTKTGIREPLYVTALKYAGVPITESIQPGYITSVKAHQCKDALTAWQASIQPPQVQEEKPTVLKVENLNFSYDGIRNVLEEINFNKRGRNGLLIGKMIRQEHPFPINLRF